MQFDDDIKIKSRKLSEISARANGDERKASQC